MQSECFDNVLIVIKMWFSEIARCTKLWPIKELKCCYGERNKTIQKLKISGFTVDIPAEHWKEEKSARPQQSSGGVEK